MRSESESSPRWGLALALFLFAAVAMLWILVTVVAVIFRPALRQDLLTTHLPGSVGTLFFLIVLFFVSLGKDDDYGLEKLKLQHKRKQQKLIVFLVSSVLLLITTALTWQGIITPQTALFIQIPCYAFLVISVVLAWLNR